MDNFIIAPLPPPLGGVGVAAANLREVLAGGPGRVEAFNTSAGSEREDLYAAKGLRAYRRALVLVFRLLRATLPLDRRRTAFHLFVTSDTAFVRDALFLAALRLQGKRVAVHLHSKTAGEFFLTPGRLPLFGRILSLADRVFVLSDDHLRFFARYIPAGKLAVLENFVLGRDFETGPDGKPSDLIYVSRLSEMKGTWELLEAVDILWNGRGRRDFHLTLAGAADTPGNEERFRRHVADRGLKEAVTFAGLVSGRAKTDLFRNAGVFVFPSRFENSPVTLKEAVQAGLAVVASDIEANRRILDRCGNSVTFPAGDAAALADVLERILDDPALFRRLRDGARTCRKFDDGYAREVLASYLA